MSYWGCFKKGLIDAITFKSLIRIFKDENWITLTCGCQSSDFGITARWKGETRDCHPCEFYGYVCKKHFDEYKAEIAEEE